LRVGLVRAGRVGDADPLRTESSSGRPVARGNAALLDALEIEPRLRSPRAQRRCAARARR
jgi:hypothetical protein